MGQLTVLRLKDPLNKWAIQKHSQIPPNAIKQKQTLRIQETHRHTNQKIISHIYFHSLVRTDMSTPPTPPRSTEAGAPQAWGLDFTYLPISLSHH